MDDPQSLNWTLINEMAAALTQEQRDQAELRIRNAGKVWMSSFKIAIGCLFALASLAFFGRITIRLLSRRRVYLDDVFLIVGFICLIASTGIFYERARTIYLIFGLTTGDELISLIASQEIENVYEQLKWSFGYITGLWTAIFSVKMCYFAFFRTLLQSMPLALIRFYWVAVAFTITAWVYLVLQQLISCPYFGETSSKCFPHLPISQQVMTFTFWTGPILDALTDAALVSIPIIVLRMSQMALLTKIGLGVFLCLSLVMMACSITRAAGTYYGGTLDTPWQVFWLHAEACIGVLMASITVYRSVLAGPNSSSRSFQRFLDKIIRMRTSERISEPEQLTKRARFGRLLLSKIPTATLTGLATLFAKTSHTYGTDNNLSTMHSTFEMRDADYHVQLKNLRSMDSAQATNQTVGSRGESGRLPSPWATNEIETTEQQRAPGRIATFFLRLLFPRSHRAILQHRTIGDGRSETELQDPS